MPVSVNTSTGKVSQTNDRGQVTGGARTVDARGNAQTHTTGGGDTRGGGDKGNRMTGFGSPATRQQPQMPQADAAAAQPAAWQNPASGVGVQGGLTAAMPAPVNPAAQMAPRDYISQDVPQYGYSPLSAGVTPYQTPTWQQPMYQQPQYGAQQPQQGVFGGFQQQLPYSMYYWGR